MKTRYIIGSISHGTMRAEDLLPKFLFAIEELDQSRATKFNTELIECGFGYSQCGACGLGNRDKWPEGFDDYADDFVNELADALNELAPPYFYFGAHPSDGADYGFWLTDDVVQQVKDNDGLVVDDTSEVPADYSGEVLHVNDHGNTTLYTADNGKLTEVWAIV
jgi:hypothetical protein